MRRWVKRESGSELKKMDVAKESGSDLKKMKVAKESGSGLKKMLGRAIICRSLCVRG